MSTTKFRAWDKREKDFWYFDLLDLLGSDDSDYGLLKEMLEEGLVNGYTGLHDKNGREIYEGDIVQYASLQPHVSPVRYNSEAAAFTTDSALGSGYRLLGKPESMIVIGNVYENPELLRSA